MELKINGVTSEFPESLTLQELLTLKNLAGQPMVIELNQAIITRILWNETKLKSGDQLEILRFVGGG